MKRLVVILVALAALVVPGRSVRSPARQLHDQPLQPRRGLGPPRSTSSTCSTSPRSRPSRPAASTRSRTRDASRRGAELTVDGKHGGAASCRRRRSRIPPARRASHDAPRGAAARARRRRLDDFDYRDTNYAGRIGWKEIVVGRNAREHERRAARVSEEPALRAARRHVGACDGRADERLLRRRSRAARRSRLPTASPTPASRSSSGASTSASGSSSRRSRPRSSGARRTRSRRATGSRSSPRTSSAAAARRGTRRCSG